MDTSDRIQSQKWQIGEDGFYEYYAYNNDGTLTSMKIGTGYPGNAADETMTFGYNGLKQLIKRTSPSLLLDYTYRTISGNSQWRDRLTQVSFTNTSGVTKTETLSYDSIGNPTQYFNGQKIWDFEWQHGRQLKTASGGGTTIENTYDMDGVRETKKVGNVTHTYTTLDGKIVREVYSGKTIDYFYDNEGRPYKLIVDGGISSNPYVGHYILNI